MEDGTERLEAASLPANNKHIDSLNEGCTKDVLSDADQIRTEKSYHDKDKVTKLNNVDTPNSGTGNTEQDNSMKNEKTNIDNDKTINKINEQRKGAEYEGINEIENNEGRTNSGEISLDIEKVNQETGLVNVQDNNLSIQEDIQKMEVTENNNSVTKPKRKKRMALEIDIKEEIDFEFELATDDGRKKYKMRDRTVKNFENNSITPEKVEALPCNRKRKKLFGKQNEQELDSYDCDECEKAFSTKTGLLNHKRIHLTVVKYTCALCVAVFDSNAQLIHHKIVHTGEDRTFTCKKCQSAFTDHREFLIHELSHQLRSHYKCTECGKYFYKKISMSAHIKTHFDLRQKCHICHKMVQTYTWASHINSHSKSISCVECGKVYSKNKEMDAHMVSHTGFKPYQCYYCGREMSTNLSRKNHMLIHKNEKPFECTICHNKFTQSSTLSKHMGTHETEKKFECDLCGKKFFRKMSLVCHLSVHYKTEKYKCNLCQKPLSTYAGLKAHMLYKHTKEKNYKCGVCDKYFKNQITLNKHNKTIVHRRKVFGSKLINGEN